MSVFDNTGNFTLIRWRSPFIYVILLIGLLYWCSWSRADKLTQLIYSVPLEMVRSSKLQILGGSQIMLCSLFIIVICVNLGGLVPYVFRVSSQPVFTLTFAFSFWLTLIASRVVLTRGKSSLARLVFTGVGVIGGMLSCWIEMLRIFLRWISLRLRLTANMMIGQIVSSLLGGLMCTYFFQDSPWLLIVMLRGTIVLMLEIAVCLLQAYLFCLLLTIYGNEHSV